MQDQTILVTGGLGFLGRSIVTTLAERHPQWKVTILDNHSDQVSDLTPKCQYVKADVTSLSEVQAAFRAVRPTAVVHAAGIVPPLADRYTRTYEKTIKNVNIGGTRNVLEAAKEAGVTALLYTSSHCAVIDDFSGHYASKYRARRSPWYDTQRI
jgi:sterol-4alpha-carboxylate 3-dehydrogenase (decarboxylating)